MKLYDIEINTEGFFDKETKEAYLKEKCVSKDDFELNASVFNSISKIEKDFDKDVKKFNQREFDDLLYSLRSQSLMSLNTKFNCIKNYCEWAASESQIEFLPVTTFYSKANLVKFLVQIPRHIKREELYKIISDNIKCKQNYVDCIVPALIYEGIKGKANSELRYLKVEDVNFDNFSIKIRDENDNIIKEKTLPMDTMLLLEKAIKQERYRVLNEDGTIEDYELPKSPYVCRTYIKKISEHKMDRRYTFSGFEALSSSKIDKKVKEVVSFMGRPSLNPSEKRGKEEKEAVSLGGRPSLNPLDIYQSRMLELLYNKEQEKGNLDVQDYKDVMIEYGENPNNYFKLKQTYVTQYNPETKDKIRKRDR